MGAAGSGLGIRIAATAATIRPVATGKATGTTGRDQGGPDLASTFGHDQ